MGQQLGRWLARRLAFALVLVLVLASSSMLLTRLAPGDATSELIGRGLSEATLEAERARLGLDQPLLVHYGQWLKAFLRLDLGTSFRFGRPVGELVWERAFNTALLAVSALVIATLVGIPLGVLSGSRRGSRTAAWIGHASTVGLSMPPLLLSLLLAFLAARTGWFPVGGMGGADVAGPWVVVADAAWHLTLPALALACPLAATLERLQSQALAEVLDQPYMQCARGRGLPTSRLVWRHGVRVALGPVLSVYGAMVGGLLSGSFAVEVVMSWPGLGRLTYDALVARDVHLVAGCAVAGGFVLAGAIIVSDLLSWFADPRLRELEA